MGGRRAGFPAKESPGFLGIVCLAGGDGGQYQLFNFHLRPSEVCEPFNWSTGAEQRTATEKCLSLNGPFPCRLHNYLL